jgi:DNA polymerase-3 subunit chi
MTRIDFYSNAESRLHTACVLVAKAFAQKMRVALFAPEAETSCSIDRLLWTFQATSFVPHCGARDKLAAATPVLIVAKLEDAGHDELMMNLSPECPPPAFSRFRRLIEVVGREEEDRQQARDRWRFYKERGYEVNHVDLAKASG